MLEMYVRCIMELTSITPNTLMKLNSFCKPLRERYQTQPTSGRECMITTAMMIHSIRSVFSKHKTKIKLIVVKIIIIITKVKG